MKENFFFVSERDRTKDCSLKKYSDSFIIGRDVMEKADLGDPRDRQRDYKSRRSFHMKTYTVKKSLDIIIQMTLHLSDSSLRLQLLCCHW